MSLLSRKLCSHCGKGILEIKTYLEGDTVEKCLICGRADGSNPIPDFILEDRKVSGRSKGKGRPKKY